MSLIKTITLAAAALALVALSAQAQLAPKYGQGMTNQYDAYGPAPFSREAQERHTW